MRTLEFDVKKQRITKKTGCDFTGLVAGSVGYLQARFYFSSDWDRCGMKTVSFWSNDEEFKVRLGADNTCMIRPEALKGDKFEVSVIGVDHPYRIGTNKTKVKQEVI